jgi:hypothetical protein
MPRIAPINTLTTLQCQNVKGPAVLCDGRGEMVTRYTWPRRSDNVSLLRSAFNGLAVTVDGTKTGNPVTVPAHPQLKAYLDAL